MGGFGKVFEDFGKSDLGKIVFPVGFPKLYFQALIKLAASAASPTAWGAPCDGPAGGRQPRGAPQAVGDAALAADFLAA